MNFDPLAKTVFDGLLAAYQNHKKLGDLGKAKDKKNGFGDMAMRADVEAEAIVFSFLHKFSKSENIHLICKSEELGENDVNPNGKKTYFAVFDGLDGSSNYLKKSEFGYGTMVAVADKKDPKYEDFIVAGEAMMEEGKIALAIKGEGVFIYDIKLGKFTQLDKFSKSEVFDDAKTLANKHFPEEINAFGDTPWVMTGSTAWSIFLVCSGSKFNGLIEATRKGNLEQPILYLMITELGGVMVDKNGESIGTHDFKVWGQGADGEEFLVTARSKGIAEQVLTRADI